MALQNVDNMKNSKSIRSNTGYKGINFIKDNGLFIAKIDKRICNRQNKKGRHYTIYIGSAKTLKKAIEIRENFIESLF